MAKRCSGGPSPRALACARAHLQCAGSVEDGSSTAGEGPWACVQAKELGAGGWACEGVGRVVQRRGMGLSFLPVSWGPMPLRVLLWAPQVQQWVPTRPTSEVGGR